MCRKSWRNIAKYWKMAWTIWRKWKEIETKQKQLKVFKWIHNNRIKHSLLRNQFWLRFKILETRITKKHNLFLWFFEEIENYDTEIQKNIHREYRSFPFLLFYLLKFHKMLYTQIKSQDCIKLWSVCIFSNCINWCGRNTFEQVKVGNEFRAMWKSSRFIFNLTFILNASEACTCSLCSVLKCHISEVHLIPISLTLRLSDVSYF